MKKNSNKKIRTIFITIVLVIVSLELLCICISEKISTEGILNKLFAFTRGTSASNYAEIMTEDIIQGSFQFNITELPSISVTKNPENYAYTIEDGISTNNTIFRSITFSEDTPTGEWIDLEITASFYNAFSFYGRQGDMVIVYSDICTCPLKDDGSVWSDYPFFLRWTAMKNPNVQTAVDADEWWFRGQAVNMKIYFYYSGTTIPINMEKGYISLFSLDGYPNRSASRYEGTNSKTASKMYVYADTDLEYLESFNLERKKLK